MHYIPLLFDFYINGLLGEAVPCSIGSGRALQSIAKGSWEC